MNQLDSQQEKAVQRACTLDGFGFFPEPRVGKTRMALTVAKRRGVQFVLIVCPKNVIGVWQTAIRTEFDDQVWTFHVTNYEFMNNKKNRKWMRDWLTKGPSIMILDEAHRIKRRSSKQSRGIRAAAVHATYRLALTGTPIAQGIHDAWAIFNFLNPEIFGPWKDFQDKYCVMGGYMGRKIVGHQNEDEFKRIMHAHSARIRLTEVANRPIRIRRTVQRIPMPRRLERIYHTLETELAVTARRVRVEAPLVITLATRLQQLTGGWLCNGDESTRVDVTKLDALVKVVGEWHPAIVVCRYLHEIEMIREVLHNRGYGVIVIKGGSPLTEPFRTDVAIIQIASGVGIDLSHAETVIFFSWDHSYINFEQMRFRILSRSRTTARYIFLMMENSIDELIYESCTKKKKLSTLICDHYRSRR